MKKLAAIVLAACMVMPVVTGCSTVTVPDVTTSETTVKELEPARAQDDYFRFINQNNFDKSKFKYGESGYELAFDDTLQKEQVKTVIKDCVAGSGYAKGSEEDVIKTAYEYFTAYDFKNEPIPKDLMDIIDAVDNAKSVDEFLMLDAKIAKDYGTTGLLGISPDINPFKPTERVIQFTQVDSVFSTSFIQMRDDQYAVNSIKDDVVMVLTTRGRDKETAGETGKALAYIAMDLYAATNVSLAEEIMSFKEVKVLSADEMNKVMTNVDVVKYLKAIGIDTSLVNNYYVYDEKQLTALNKIFVEENLDALKAWELGIIYSRYMRYIAPHYQQLESYVGRNYKSIEEQAVEEIRTAFSDQTDPIYVERYYSKATDDALRKMCDDIRGGYRNIIKNASWLSEETRTELLQKLENIVYITGTGLKRHNNAEYANICGKNYYELTLNISRLKTQRLIDDFNDQKPVTRTESDMPMQMMNACYDPSGNTICITVAITNKPFFDVDADFYTNLGGLGSVIAHEMGHAFDSDCIQFNSKGEYDPNWIPDSDMQKLLERNEKAKKYFEDNFTVFGVYHVDGKQTLGENYADLGGVECITSLCKTKEDRIKLFESYATIWCMMSTDDAIINQLAYDSHSPSYIRVNAILGSIKEFYETYDVKEGDGMYIAPENRISRWY